MKLQLVALTSNFFSFFFSFNIGLTIALF